MIRFSFGIGLFLFAFIILFNQLVSKKVVYDCRMATFPTAVDVPQEVIRQCRSLI